jgi:hypothetical protein
MARDESHQGGPRPPSITVDRNKYLKRALAMQLLQLDQLEVAFRDNAFEDRDVASGMLLVKVAERRATLLGLNAPIGHAVAVVQAPPTARSTDAMVRSLARIMACANKARRLSPSHRFRP